MGSNDLVSVIIPVFNAADYLCSCLDSVIEQTHKNIEILLIDDGSMDDSGIICESYRSKHGNIRLLGIKNSGQSVARNLGLANSTGEYVLFVDADDELPPNAISDLLKGYSHKVDLVVGNYGKVVGGDYVLSSNEKVFDGDRRLDERELRQYIDKYLDKPYAYLLFVYCWGKLFKSSVIRSNNILFNTNLSHMEDMAFNFEYLKCVNSVFYVSTPVYLYFIHARSKSSEIGGDISAYHGFMAAFKVVGEYSKKEIGHFCVSWIIMIILRASRRKYPYRFIRGVINDEFLQNSLNCYRPTGKDSRVMPLLIKLKLTRLLILFSRFKLKCHKFGRG